MLPLFDVVFVEPAATFSLSHAKIGSNPEGISIMQFSGKVRANAVSWRKFCFESVANEELFQTQRLLYLNETLNASEAHSSGLITKIIEGDFDKELISSCTRISGFSSQVCWWSPILKSFIPCAMRPIQHSTVEKLRIEMFEFCFFGEVSTIMHSVACTALKYKSKVRSCESAKLSRAALWQFWKKVRISWPWKYFAIFSPEHLK